MPAATQKLCSLHYETGDQGASVFAADGVGAILLSAGQKRKKEAGYIRNHTSGTISHPAGIILGLHM